MATISRRSLLQLGAKAMITSPFAAQLSADTKPSPNCISPNAKASPGLVMLDATELSIAIHNKKVSCVEVMQAYLEQIDRLNPTFNCIVARAEDDVLIDQARQYDDELELGASRGWMHGFPVAIKDLAHAKGFITSMGSKIFADTVATTDSVHVARIKGAGAIVVGKTNVPEFGLGSQSYNSVYGVTRCAYDASKTAGGSSGGAASGLALRMLPIADGSDMMGSLRNPGAFNNVIGFRPTPGVVPLGNNFQEQLACNGPMGRNVTDTARALATMAGADMRTPAALPVNAQDFRSDLRKDWTGARIGWLGDFDGYLATEPGIMSLCESALVGFRHMGCLVEDVKVGYSMPELWQTWLTYRHWGSRGKGLALLQNRKMRQHLKPEFIWEIEGGEGITGDQLSVAMNARGRWYQALVDLFERYDALVWPTAQVFPFAAETHWPKTIAGKSMDTYHRWMETVVPGTLSGCPVINVPAGFSEQGLPMGLQLMTPRYQDFKALQLAYGFEQTGCTNLSHLPEVV
jgi:amidase